MKTSVAPAASPGSDSGSTTCRKARAGLAPRERAASGRPGSRRASTAQIGRIMKGRRAWIMPIWTPRVLKRGASGRGQAGIKARQHRPEGQDHKGQEDVDQADLAAEAVEEERERLLGQAGGDEPLVHHATPPKQDHPGETAGEYARPERDHHG